MNPQVTRTETTSSESRVTRHARPSTLGQWTFALATLVTAATCPGQELWLGQFGYSAGGWRAEMHPRAIADVNADGKADVVGFGNDGVYVSLSTGSSFAPATRALADFGYYAGGWRVERHPRMLADVNGDGRPDIVGFADDGVYVALSLGGTGFSAPTRFVDSFGYYAGGWRIEKHPRFVVDVTGDGKADIIGFGDDGVYVSVSNGYSFSLPQRMLTNFGYLDSAGTWRVESHPRLMADVNRDGKADIVGFGHAGVYVSLALGSGQFGSAQLWNSEFGSVTGWRIDAHPRFVVDMNKDGRADIVGFASDGVYVALSTGASFSPRKKWSPGADFGYSTGWRVEQHPRMLADWNGDGYPDVIGFGDAAVYVGTNSSGNSLQSLVPWTSEFDVNSGWMVDQHPRMVADVNGDRRADIVGFAARGVLVQSPPTARPYGSSCFGALDAYLSFGSRADVRRVFLSHHGTERTYGAIVVGVTAVNVPLFAGCVLLANPEVVLPATPVGQTVSELQFDAAPAVKVPLFVQYLATNRAGQLIASNGVEVRL